MIKVGVQSWFFPPSPKSFLKNWTSRRKTKKLLQKKGKNYIIKSVSKRKKEGC